MINKELDNILENNFLNKIIHNENFCNFNISSTNKDCTIKLNLEISISRESINSKRKFYLNIEGTKIKTQFVCFEANFKETKEIKETDVEEFLIQYVKSDKNGMIIFLLNLVESLGIGYDNTVKKIIKDETEGSIIDALLEEISIYTTSDKGYEINFCY